MSLFYKYIFLSVLIAFSFYSCDKPTVSSNEIVPSDDVRIGQTIDEEFFKYSDSSDYFNILDNIDYSEVYNYCDSIILLLLNSGQFEYTSDFNWKIRIYDQAESENSFALPGGYFYISKGLINALDNEAQFAAVIAHAMNLSDSRIITERLKDRFTASYLLDISLGGNVVTTTDLFDEIMNSPLDNSESESLENSTVQTLCKTDYDIREFTSCLNKFLSNNSSFEWISHYPSNSSRVTNLNNQYNLQNCGGSITNPVDFEKFKMILGR